MECGFPFKSKTVTQWNPTTTFGRQIDARGRDSILGAPRPFSKRLAYACTSVVGKQMENLALGYLETIKLLTEKVYQHETQFGPCKMSIITISTVSVSYIFQVQLEWICLQDSIYFDFCKVAVRSWFACLHFINKFNSMHSIHQLLLVIQRIKFCHLMSIPGTLPASCQ